jgi:hypothetical protein
MNLKQLVEKAANKVGGPSQLAYKLGCEPAVITRAKESGKPPVWLAGACAQLTGDDIARAELEAHAAASRSDAESAHWSRRLRGIAGSVLAASLLISNAGNIAQRGLTQVDDLYTLCSYISINCLRRPMAICA